MTTTVAHAMCDDERTDWSDAGDKSQPSEQPAHQSRQGVRSCFRCETVTRMATSRKPATPVAAKRTKRKTSVEPASKPFMRFHHSEKLRVKTLAVLEAVESADKPSAHSARLTDLVLELTDCGMDQYFLQSLKDTKANFVVQQSAALGMSGVQKVMGTVIRNMLGRMDDRQLLSVCGSIRRFMA